MNKIDDLLEEGKYLPVAFRDFHDQKDLFKLIHSKVNLSGFELHFNDRFSWQSGHVYTVDVFLWFMAKRGYTLQKSRHDIDFIDIKAEIKEMKDQTAAELNSLFNQPESGDTK